MSEVKVNKISPRTNCGTVQLGDSGDTITIPAGATITNNGTQTGFGRTGAVDWDTTAKTAAFTAVSGNGYFVNTTSGAITVTLPASPSAGDIVAISDYAQTSGTNNITLARNGSNIQGNASDLIMKKNGIALTLVYVDGTKGWVVTDSGAESDRQPDQEFVIATGGTITTCGDFKIHTFTGPGTFCVTNGGNSFGSNSVDYLVVAGGGGTTNPNCNGAWGGGGGAGGFRTNYPSSCSGLPVSIQGYPITVGGGGSIGGNGLRGNSGSNSIFSSITSTGGGGGGYYAGGAPPQATGLPGGSGGGGGGCSPNGLGGCGNTPPVSPPQGNDGANGKASVSEEGGGGGGAGAAGQDGALGGAIGSPIAINPSPTVGTPGPAPGRYFAGGGTGSNSRRDNAGNPTNPGSAGGGGAGGSGINSIPGVIDGTPGTTNTGGGGGAPNSTGGSGIVIIRYRFQ